MPLLVYVGDVPLWTELRTADADPARGVEQVLEKVAAALRRRCPQARIIVRGDSEFAREQIMRWCEDQPAHRGPVYYRLGLAQSGWWRNWRWRGCTRERGRV